MCLKCEAHVTPTPSRSRGWVRGPSGCGLSDEPFADCSRGLTQRLRPSPYLEVTRRRTWANTPKGLPPSSGPRPLVSAQAQVVSCINHKITATISVGELVLEICEQAWTGTAVVTTAKLDEEVLARGVALDYAARTDIRP